MINRDEDVKFSKIIFVIFYHNILSFQRNRHIVFHGIP